MRRPYIAVSPWLLELLRFGIVGVVGFVANAASVVAISKLTNLYVTGAIAWVIAATVTWYLNRIWTFSENEHGPVLSQWIQFLGANSFGLVLYYTTYVIAISAIPQCASQPIFAVAAGSLVGLIANFTLSRRFVFR